VTRDDIVADAGRNARTMLTRASGVAGRSEYLAEHYDVATLAGPPKRVLQFLRRVNALQLDRNLAHAHS
jgi:hypothetical protein